VWRVACRLVSRSAYFRLYVPQDAVDGYREHLGAASQSRVLTLGEYGIWHESVRDDAFVIDFEGSRYVCPRHPRLRMLEGLLAFRNAYDGPIAQVLVPEEVAVRAASELERMQSRMPGVRSHILTSAFFVPLRWFAAFDASERLIAEGERGFSVKYRTRRVKAIARLIRAARVLETAGFDDTIVDQIGDLFHWMEPFPDDAVVELDYGEVALLFDDAELVLDESAAEVGASLDALERGDLEQAGEHYAVAISRWAHAQSLLYVN
jgi:hypothetical protein